MFRKKAPKRIVELNIEEARLLMEALMNFRNKVIQAGKPPEDINDLLCTISRKI